MCIWTWGWLFGIRWIAATLVPEIELRLEELGLVDEEVLPGFEFGIDLGDVVGGGDDALVELGGELLEDVGLEAGDALVLQELGLEAFDLGDVAGFAGSHVEFEGFLGVVQFAGLQADDFLVEAALFPVGDLEGELRADEAEWGDVVVEDVEGVGVAGASLGVGAQLGAAGGVDHLGARQEGCFLDL